MWKRTIALLVVLMAASALTGIGAHAGASPSHASQDEPALPCCDGDAAQPVGSNCPVCGAALSADWNAPPSARPGALRAPLLRLERPIAATLPWHPPA